MKKEARQTEYQQNHIKALKDSREAAAYLNAAFEEEDVETFLLVLQNLVEAHGGVKAVADKACVNEESLHRTLSRLQQSEIFTLFILLRGIGFRLIAKSGVNWTPNPVSTGH